MASAYGITRTADAPAAYQTEKGTAGIIRMDMPAGQPDGRSRACSESTRGWRTSQPSCQPTARTNSSAMTALPVLATTASGDAEEGAEKQSCGQRERGARERKDRHHDVSSPERQREPGPNRGHPVAQLDCGGQPNRTRNCHEDHDRCQDGEEPARRDLRGRRDHRSTQRPQGVDDGFHVYEATGRADNSRQGRESAARRTMV